MNIPGYEKYVNFKFTDLDLGASGKRGIAIYIKEDLEAEEIKMHTKYEDQLWVEVKLRNNDSLLCGCIYRSPTKYKLSTKETTTKVCDIISEAVQLNKSRLLICGEFNYPEIDWECEYLNIDVITPFIDTLQVCHLHQHVCKPTRYRDGQDPSLLDLILTTEEGMVHNLEHEPGIGESDHECLRFSLNCYKDNPQKKAIPNCHKAHYATIRSRLQDIVWIHKLRGGFLDAYSVFLDELETSMEGCIPNKINTRKKKSNYLSRNTLKLKDQKIKIWIRYKKSRTNYDRMRYLRAKNDLRSLTRRLRLNFENSIAQDIKLHPKTFWAYVKSRTKTKSSIPSLKKVDGSKALTASDKAEALNNFFSSTFTDENLENIPVESLPFLGEYLDKFEITPDLVLTKLKELNPTKAPGPDGWHPVLLKNLADLIALPLSIIFQKSLNEGFLPSQWLKACVTAIPKKDDKGLPENTIDQ